MARFRVPSGNPNPPGRVIDPKMIPRGGNHVIDLVSQLAPYYGGKQGVLDAIIDAQAQAKQNTLHEASRIGGSEYRELFPEPEYDRVNDAINVEDRPDIYDEYPLNGELVTERTVNADGSLMDAPNVQGPEVLPAIMTEPMPEGMPDDPTIRRQQVIEAPLTEYLTGTDYDKAVDPEGVGPRNSPLMGSEFSDIPDIQAILGETSPARIDRNLAQIRRSLGQGASAVPYEDARLMLDKALLGKGDSLKAGLSSEDVHAMRSMPEHIQDMMRRRLGELIGLGGVGVGMGLGSGQNGQGINPRSTMGPLGGLME